MTSTIAKKSRITVLITVLFFMSLTLSAQVINQDKPEKGTWNFNLKKVWEVDQAGTESFRMPAEMRVSKNEEIVFRDFMGNKSFLFDKDGKFIKSFAAGGSEPGQVKRYLNCFSSEENIVIGEPDKLHFYNFKGEYEKSFPNNLFARFPLAFLDKHRFIYVEGLPEGKPVLKSLDISSGDESVFYEFPEGEKSARSNMLVLGVTPQLRMAADIKSGQFYFGRNDEYNIHVSDKNGREIRNFALDRKRKQLTEEIKRKSFENSRMPKAQLEALIKSLPDKLAQFFTLQFNDGLIYVFPVNQFERRLNKLQIDIFSPEGEYLYVSHINFENDEFFGNPENLTFFDNHLYVILKREDGKKSVLCKFEISLPGK